MADRTILPVGQPRTTLPVPPPVRPAGAPAVAANGPFLQNAYAKYGQNQVNAFLAAVAKRPAPSPLAALAPPAPTHASYQSAALNNPAFAQARQHITDTSTAAGNDINAATNNAVGSMLGSIAQQNTYHQQNANALQQDAQAKLQAYRNAIGGLSHDADLARFGGLGAVTSQSLTDQAAINDAANRVKAYENTLGNTFQNTTTDLMHSAGDVGQAAQQTRLVNEFGAMQKLDQQAQQALAAAASAGRGGGGGRRGSGGRGGSGGGGGSSSGGPNDAGPDFGMMAEGLQGQYMPGGLSDSSQNYYNLARQMLANGTRPQEVKTFFDRLGQQNRAKGGGLMKGGTSGFGSIKAMDNYINAYNKMVGSKLSKLYGTF